MSEGWALTLFLGCTLAPPDAVRHSTNMATSSTPPPARSSSAAAAAVAATRAAQLLDRKTVIIIIERKRARTLFCTRAHCIVLLQHTLRFGRRDVVVGGERLLVSRMWYIVYSTSWTNANILNREVLCGKFMSVGLSKIRRTAITHNH